MGLLEANFPSATRFRQESAKTFAAPFYVTPPPRADNNNQ